MHKLLSKRLFINTISLGFGYLCHWSSSTFSNNWSSDRNVFLQFLNYLDDPFVAYLFASLLSFALLAKLLKTKIAHPLLLAIIAVCGYLILSAGGMLIAIIGITYIFMPSPFLALLYIPIFHFATKRLPQNSSWQIFQRPLLVLSIPLTLFATLPLQNSIINSSGPETLSRIAKQFFGYDIIGNGQEAIYNCQPFLDAYGPIIDLNFQPDNEIVALKQYQSINNLNYEFSNSKGIGTIRVNSISKENLQHDLYISTPYKFAEDVLNTDDTEGTGGDSIVHVPNYQVASTGPHGPIYTVNLSCN